MARLPVAWSYPLLVITIAHELSVYPILVRLYVYMSYDRF